MFKLILGDLSANRNSWIFNWYFINISFTKYLNSNPRSVKFGYFDITYWWELYIDLIYIRDHGHLLPHAISML